MKRRAFLTLLPAALLLPELILPRKTFFLPPLRGWSGDDTVYLQALLDRGIPIPAGDYTISETLHWPCSNYTMRNLILRADENRMVAKPMIQFDCAGENCLIDSCHFYSALEPWPAMQSFHFTPIVVGTA